MRLRLPVSTEFRYPDDVKRIADVCRAAGYTIDLNTAEKAWDTYSERYAAGWLILPHADEELLCAVLSVCTAVEE